MTVGELQLLVETYVNFGTYVFGFIILFCLTYVVRRILGHYDCKKGGSLERIEESFWISLFISIAWPLTTIFITFWIVSNTIEKSSEFLASRFTG